eukprot:23731_1
MSDTNLTCPLNTCLDELESQHQHSNVFKQEDTLIDFNPTNETEELISHEQITPIQDIHIDDQWTEQELIDYKVNPPCICTALVTLSAAYYVVTIAIFRILRLPIYPYQDILYYDKTDPINIIIVCIQCLIWYIPCIWFACKDKLKCFANSSNPCIKVFCKFIICIFYCAIVPPLFAICSLNICFGCLVIFTENTRYSDYDSIIYTFINDAYSDRNRTIRLVSLYHFLAKYKDIYYLSVRLDIDKKSVGYFENELLSLKHDCNISDSFDKMNKKLKRYTILSSWSFAFCVISVYVSMIRLWYFSGAECNYHGWCYSPIYKWLVEIVICVIYVVCKLVSNSKCRALIKRNIFKYKYYGYINIFHKRTKINGNQEEIEEENQLRIESFVTDWDAFYECWKYEGEFRAEIQYILENKLCTPLASIIIQYSHYNEYMDFVLQSLPK